MARIDITKPAYESTAMFYVPASSAGVLSPAAKTLAVDVAIRNAQC